MSGLVIDHLIQVVADLDAATAAYGAAGFTVSARPDVPNGRSNTRFIAFADGSYIMLMQYLSDAAARAHRLGPAAARGDGWADYSFLTGDMDADVARLTAAGVTVAGPAAHVGALTTGAAWALRIAYAGRGAAGDPALPYLVADTAARALRLPPDAAATRHGNGATGIAEIRVIVAPGSLAPAGLAALLPRLDAPTRFAAGAATVTLMAGETPGVAGVTLTGTAGSAAETVIAGARLIY